MLEGCTNIRCTVWGLMVEFFNFFLVFFVIFLFSFFLLILGESRVGGGSRERGGR